MIYDNDQFQANISMNVWKKNWSNQKKKTYLECTCNPTSMNPRWWWNTMTGRCSMNIFFIQNYSLLLLLLLLLLLKMFEKIWHSKQEKKRSIMDEEIDLDLNIFFSSSFQSQLSLMWWILIIYTIQSDDPHSIHLITTQLSIIILSYFFSVLFCTKFHYRLNENYYYQLILKIGNQWWFV